MEKISHSKLKKELSDAWICWCGLVRALEVEDDARQRRAVVEDLCNRLNRFRDSKSKLKGETVDLHLALTQISRAKALCDTALNWKTPRIGGESRTDRTRGEQWRLVIAYAALETMFKAQSPPKHRPLHEGALISHSKMAEKFNFPSPSLTKAQIEKWLSRDTLSGSMPQKVSLSRFLGFSPGYDAFFRGWLLGNTQLSSPDQGLQLATCFRHATVHGVLSATKIKEWHLQKQIISLNDLLMVTFIRCLQRLIQ